MRKKDVSNKPKVTNLPLPVTDNPLVIDLPDGQKIVVGKLQPGSVIEVATWRGTGRPDSRTNRLMMGMNTGTASAEEKVDSNQKTAPAKKAKINLDVLKVKSIIFIKKAGVLSKRFISSLKNWFIGLRKDKQKPLITASQNKPISSPSADVDEWLAKIIEKSERKRELESRKDQMGSINARKQKINRDVKVKKSQAPKRKKSR